METPVLRYKLTNPYGGSTALYGIIMLAGGMWLFMDNLMLVALFVLLGVLAFMQYKCLEIDFYKGTYCVGTNIMGYTFGAREPYPGAKCIFIKKNRTFQSSSNRSWRRTVHTSFDSFLWLEDNTKIPLSCDGTKELAMQRIQPFAQELQTDIKDLTAPLSHL